MVTAAVFTLNITAAMDGCLPGVDEQHSAWMNNMTRQYQAATTKTREHNEETSGQIIETRDKLNVQEPCV